MRPSSRYFFTHSASPETISNWLPVCLICRRASALSENSFGPPVIFDAAATFFSWSFEKWSDQVSQLTVPPAAPDSLAPEAHPVITSGLTPKANEPRSKVRRSIFVLSRLAIGVFLLLKLFYEWMGGLGGPCEPHRLANLEPGSVKVLERMITER